MLCVFVKGLSEAGCLCGSRVRFMVWCAGPRGLMAPMLDPGSSARMRGKEIDSPFRVDFSAVFSRGRHAQMFGRNR